MAGVGTSGNVTRVAETIEGYRILWLEQLGRGGFGTVYLGEKSPSDRVAVKVMIAPPQYSADYSKCYKRELDALGKTDHPNIVKLLYSKTDADCVYLLLELCDTDLLRFAHGNDLTEELKYEFISNILSAVLHLHALSIVHRDIKPENMLIKTQGPDQYVLKLSDLGLSMRIPDDGSSVISASPGVGTFGWKAQEVIPDARNPTPRTLHYGTKSDCFATGLNLHSISSHRPGEWLQPMTGPHGEAYGEYVRCCLAESRPVQEFELSTPLPDLHPLIAGLLEPEPKQRWSIEKAHDTFLSIRALPSAQVASSTQQSEPTGPSLPGPELQPMEVVMPSPEVTTPSITAPGLPSAQEPSSTQQIPSTGPSLPRPDLHPLTVVLQSPEETRPSIIAPWLNTAAAPVTVQQSVSTGPSLPRPGVILVQLHRRAMPHKPPTAIINFGLGQELDVLWLESQKPDLLHYSKYRDGVWEEAWTKEMPREQPWNCRKYASSMCILLQSVSNDVCLYDPETLEQSGRSCSPGWVVGLTAQGRAVVGSHASSTVTTLGVTLHVCELDSLQTPVVTLRLPEDKTYGMDSLPRASGASDGHVAVTDGKNYVDLFAPDGHHICRVDLPGEARRPSCTTRHVFVPVRCIPPTIAVISWRGEVQRWLGATDLGLRRNECCWSISPTHDGKFNVLVTDTEYQDFIVTYQVEP